MRPPAKRRKNAVVDTLTGTRVRSFNEAACKEAEKLVGGGRDGRRMRGFNEAACKEAEKPMPPDWIPPPSSCFNEAACKEAEKRTTRAARQDCLLLVLQ